MEPAAEKLLGSPALALHVRAFQRVLDEERARREHFYETVQEDQKAEFINGEIIMHSPARKRHLDCVNHLLMLMNPYVRIHDLGYVASEKLMVSLTRNDYEPDVCFFRKEKAEAFTRDQWRFPTPDFIAEILSPSTEKVDRNVKFQDYAAHGVEELWLIDPDAEVLEQYVLEEEEYALRMKSGTGEVKSVAVEGFEIPVRALFDAAANLSALRRIMADA